MNNDIYYKIYFTEEDKKYTIVCIQWFDECSYKEDSFYKNNEGIVLRFNTENEAKKYLNKNVKQEFIDSEYLDYKNYLK